MRKFLGKLLSLLHGPGKTGRRPLSAVDLLNALMQHLPDNIYFKDRDSRFIRISRAAAKWFGLSKPAEAVGKTDFDLFALEHAEAAYKDEQRIIQTGEPLLHVEEKETWPGGDVT